MGEDMNIRECRHCEYRITEVQWAQARYDYLCPRCGDDIHRAGTLSDYHPVKMDQADD